MQLRKWADLLVIAPLDANTMAKMATGLCDNLLVLVCWYWTVLNHYHYVLIHLKLKLLFPYVLLAHAYHHN